MKMKEDSLGYEKDWSAMPNLAALLMVNIANSPQVTIRSSDDTPWRHRGERPGDLLPLPIGILL
jgi:hypothetical protein